MSAAGRHVGLRSVVLGLSFLVVLGIACHARTAGVRSSPEYTARASPQIGLASYYGPGFHGEPTASGEIFDQNKLVAAHPTLPFGTIVRVTNLENGRNVQLRIHDRGPAVRHQRRGVVIDVSKGAARRLGFITDGLIRVRVDVLKFGNP